MSTLELDRLTVIERVGEGRLTQVEASKQLGVTPRHLRRLMRGFDNDGAQALVSKKRGKRSNRAYADTVKTRVVELVRNHYVDFGPTLIAEKLVEKHDTVLSRETLRQWLMEAGIWRSRQQRPQHRYPLRQQLPSQGACRAHEQDLAGSPGQGAPS